MNFERSSLMPAEVSTRVLHRNKQKGNATGRGMHDDCERTCRVDARQGLVSYRFGWPITRYNDLVNSAVVPPTPRGKI